jgi:hypothetical protein
VAQGEPDTEDMMTDEVDATDRLKRAFLLRDSIAEALVEAFGWRGDIDQVERAYNVAESLIVDGWINDWPKDDDE